jgi:hypothetical protein
VGVSISIAGAISSPDARKDLLRWIGSKADDLEWTRRPVELGFKKARLRSGARMRALELPRASGVSLLPHFASEELPLVFLEADGTLVEEVVDDYATETPTFLAGVLVKTQFAGPAVHREICEVLREMMSRFAPKISVDDETGFMTSSDPRALERGFAEGWSEIRAKIEADRPGPGARFQVGEFPFEVPTGRIAGEFGSLKEDERKFLLSCETAFTARFGGFGTNLDHSRSSVVDLELAISDVDAPDFPRDAGNPDVQALAVEAGAYFGRTIASVLGGAWRFEDGQFLLVDVGRSGLVVDPFEVARDRILEGPPFSFRHHLGVYDELTKNLARETR